MTALTRLLDHFRRRPEPDSSVEILALDRFNGPVYVIGDVHGSLAAYRDLETLITQDAQNFIADPTVVLLGDIVDRGAQTAALIDHLLAQRRKGARLICLRGNHEEMMLNFLENPKQHLSWLEFGGYETLASYGLVVDMARVSQIRPRQMAQMVAAHIPDPHIRFLRETLPAIQVGNFLLAHAGADANSSLLQQSKRALIWGDLGQKAPNGLTLVHGHYIVKTPESYFDRIAIDTGAYVTGRLTCLRLAPDQLPAYATTTDFDRFQTLCGFTGG